MDFYTSVLNQTLKHNMINSITPSLYYYIETEEFRATVSEFLTFLFDTHIQTLREAQTAAASFLSVRLSTFLSYSTIYSTHTHKHTDAIMSIIQTLHTRIHPQNRKC